MPGGWLLRLRDGAAEPVADLASLVLDLTAVPARVTVTGPGGEWRHTLTLRHAEILLALVVHPAGRSAAQLAQDLFGAAARTVTVRAEVSRLRRSLGTVLQHQPYAFADGVHAEVLLPAGELLPSSHAPLVLERRRAAAVRPS